MTDFNYRDNDAVVLLTKKVMRKNLPDYDSENNIWRTADEMAWRGFCNKMGAVYTPFPDIGLQPDEIKKLFAKNEEGVVSEAHVPVVPRIDIKQYMIQSVDPKHPNYAPDLRASQSDHSGVNWSANKRIMEGYRAKPPLSANAIVAAIKTETGAKPQFRRKKLTNITPPSVERELSNDEIAKALIVR